MQYGNVRLLYLGYDRVNEAEMQTATEILAEDGFGDVDEIRVSPHQRGQETELPDSRAEKMF